MNPDKIMCEACGYKEATGWYTIGRGHYFNLCHTCARDISARRMGAPRK